MMIIAVVVVVRRKEFWMRGIMRIWIPAARRSSPRRWECSMITDRNWPFYQKMLPMCNVLAHELSVGTEGCLALFYAIDETYAKM